MKRLLFLIPILLAQGGWAADWTWVEVGPEGGAMTGVSVNPADSSVLAASLFSDGYLNQGTTWQRVLPLAPAGGGNLISFLLPDTSVFVRNENGELFRSVDGGLTWAYVRSFCDRVLGLSEVKSAIAYIVAQDWTNTVDSLYRTTDAGANWETLGILPIYFQEEVAITSFLDTLIFIGGWAQDSNFVLKSDDGGLSWNTVVWFSNPAEGGVHDLEWDPSMNTLWTCFDPGPPSPISLPPVHLYNDSLGAAAFSDELKDAGIYIVKDLEFCLQDTLLAGGLTGIYKLVKTTQWDSVWVGPHVDSSAAVSDIDMEGNAFWATSDAGCLNSSDTGNTWQYQNDGISAVTVLSHSQLSGLADETLYTGSVGALVFGPLYKSTDEGATWQCLQQGPEFALLAEILPSDPDTAYVQGLSLSPGYTYHSVARSLDGGVSWTWMNSFPPDSFFQETMVSDLWVSPSNQDLLLRIAGVVWQLYPGPVLRSADGGSNWSEVLPHNMLYITGGDTVFASWDSTWVSYDAGLTWNLFSQMGGWIDWDKLNDYLYLLAKGDTLNLYQYDLTGDSTLIFGPFRSAVSDLSVSPLGHVYLSWVDENFVPQMARSTDLGSTWEIDTLNFIPGLVKACSTAVIAAELGRGFRRSTDIVGIEERMASPRFIPTLVVLPNPFFNSATIRYAIPAESAVSVAVYDVTGRLTQVLEKGRKRQGTYQVSWDGKDARGSEVSSGIYFARLEIENQGAATIGLLRLRN